MALWNWRAGLIAAGIVTLSYIVPPAKPVFKGSNNGQNDAKATLE